MTKAEDLTWFERLARTAIDAPIEAATGTRGFYNITAHAIVGTPYRQSCRLTVTHRDIARHPLHSGTLEFCGGADGKVRVTHSFGWSDEGAPAPIATLEQLDLTEDEARMLIGKFLAMFFAECPVGDYRTGIV